MTSILQFLKHSHALQCLYLVLVGFGCNLLFFSLSVAIWYGIIVLKFGIGGMFFFGYFKETGKHLTAKNRLKINNPTHSMQE